jgi:protein involved in polysaccharide export with SLBB domain
MRYNLVALLLAFAFRPASADARPVATPPAVAAHGVGGEIRAFEMDEIGNPTTTTVTASGNILMPLLEPVPVTGKTPEQIRDLLQERYKGFYQTPRLTVALFHPVADVPNVARPGDTIRIRAFEPKELNGLSVPVAGNGNAMVLVLGDLPVGGKTPEAIQAMLKEAAKKYWQRPSLAVDIVAPTPGARPAGAVADGSAMWWTAADAKRLALLLLAAVGVVMLVMLAGLAMNRPMIVSGCREALLAVPLAIALLVLLAAWRHQPATLTRALLLPAGLAMLIALVLPPALKGHLRRRELRRMTAMDVG